MTKKSKIFAIIAAAASLAVAGCASRQPQPARYVDSGSPETVVSLEKVNVQDFAMAAEALVKDMLMEDAFAETGKKPVIALSRVMNDTSNNFDTALLTDKVQEMILKSRKATVSMSMSVDRKNDSVAEDVAALGETETVIPDMTLIGTISEITAREKSTRQVSYVFKMRLVGTRTRNIVWMGEKVITKQGQRDSVGW